MKKNIIYFLSCLVLTVGLVSCSDDDKEPLSPLTVVIEGAEAQEVVQGATLNLKAVVEGSSEVKYVWTLNGKEVSTTPAYEFTATDLGKSEIQLKVSNAEQGEAAAKLDLDVYGKYKYGTFILNEGASLRGDKGGSLIFISPEGELVEMAFQKENNGAWLGSVPQDVFIANNKMYIVSQNGGNEGGFLTIVNAETLKLETAFGDELKSQVSWPTHVAVLGDDNIYLRDNGGIKLFHPSTGEATLIEGTKGARKNTMAVVGGKVFASQNKNLLVIESGKDKVSATVEFDGNISGVVKSSDNNVWVSVSTGKIAKVSAKDYSIIKENDLSADKDATKTLSASFSAAPSITAKGDTLYMSGLATKVYRHIFSTNETKLMVDAKEMVENANIVYNTVAVDPVTEGVYLNTIKGYGDNVSINQISIFDFSGATPTLKAHYNDCTRYPAGVFFTSNFR